jgi:hypothetical protein
MVLYSYFGYQRLISSRTILIKPIIIRTNVVFDVSEKIRWGLIPPGEN